MRRVFTKSHFMLIGLVFFSALTLASSFSVQRVNAYTCTDNGLACDIGYFSRANLAAGAHHNLYYGNDGTWGGSPFLLGLRVNNAYDLEVTMQRRLNCKPGFTGVTNPADQNTVGAAFTVLTMLGAPPGTNKDVACQRLTEWQFLMTDYDNAHLIHWAEWQNLDGVNTRLSFNGGTDVTYYADNEPPSDQSITFYAPDNVTVLYKIKRDCGNPIGRTRALAGLTYSLHGSVNSTPTGTVEPGTNVSFNYTVTNSPAQKPSDDTTCTIYTIVRNGYVSGTPPHTGGDPSRTVTCPSVPIGGTYTIPGSDNFTAAANKTYCRELVINKSDQNGGTSSAESCVVVVSKPYVSVFGGDISAGNGFGTSCTEDTRATVVGWNKRSPSFAGAGTQYAAYVLNTLTDFATAQNIAGGSAVPPSGFAFSNAGITAGNQASGIFGQALGTSLPCLPDYAGNQPSGASPVGGIPGPGLAVNSLPNGPSKYVGNLTIAGGSLGSNQNITLYVTGNVYIKGNITYTGSWATVDQIPNLQIIANKGNIYIDGAVTQLDGSYIAQPNGALEGVIYTCTDPVTPFGAIATTNPGNPIYNACSNKLTVNGSFTARHVELLRTSGTLAQSGTGETSTSNNAAEVFNYNPTLWIAQPLPGSSTSNSSDTYDSVVSLPPVL